MDQNEMMADPVMDTKKNCRKTYSKIALALAVSYAAAVLGAYGLRELFSRLIENKSISLSETTVNILISFVPMYLLCFPIIILVLWKMKKTVPEKSKMQGKQIFKLFTMCFPIIFVGNMVGTFLSMILSNGKSVNNIGTLVQSLDPLIIIVAVIIAPVFEELIFRKMIIDRTLAYGEKAAILFSALTFGMFHMNLYQLFYAFGIGLILGYIYVRSGNIKITLLFHVIINGLSSFLVHFLLYKSEYMEFVQMLGDKLIDEEFIAQHAVWISLYMGYVMVYFATVCFGLAMMIVNRKKIYIEHREGELSTASGIKASFINAGMIVYIIMTIALIAFSLISVAIT